MSLSILLFYFILFYFILFYFILFYFIVLIYLTSFLSFLIVAFILFCLFSFHFSISSCFCILSLFSSSFFSIQQSRGFVGRNEMYRKFQGDCLPGGYDHFNWVIFDEVHAIDGEDGDALQRLIRAMSCKFLALSATVGNAQELRGWLERVRGDQLLGKPSFIVHYIALHCTALDTTTASTTFFIPFYLPVSTTSLSPSLSLLHSFYPSLHLHSSPIFLSFSVLSFVSSFLPF